MSWNREILSFDEENNFTIQLMIVILQMDKSKLSTDETSASIKL